MQDYSTLSSHDVPMIIGALDEYFSLVMYDPSLYDHLRKELSSDAKRYMDLYSTLRFGEDFSGYEMPPLYDLDPDERTFYINYYKYREFQEDSNRKIESMKKEEEREKERGKKMKEEKGVREKKRKKKEGDRDRIKRIIKEFESYYASYPEATLVDLDDISDDASHFVDIDSYLRRGKPYGGSERYKKYEKIYEKIYKRMKENGKGKEEEEVIHIPYDMKDTDPTADELLDEEDEIEISSRYFGEISNRTIGVVTKIVQFCQKRKLSIIDLDEILAYFLYSVPADYSEPFVTAACAIMMTLNVSVMYDFLAFVGKRKLPKRILYMCDDKIIDQPEETIFNCGYDDIMLGEFLWYANSMSSTRSICDYIDRIKSNGGERYYFREVISEKMASKIIRILTNYVTDKNSR